MTKDATPSFLTRIRNELHSMHPAERRLADFVLNFPSEIASYSASELARLANVSNATISRFIQRLGYANYDDARRHVRAEKEGGAAIFLGGSSDRSPDHDLEQHVQHGLSNIERTFRTVSLQEIDNIARCMVEARRVWVIGFRSAQSLATYLRWQTIQVIDNIDVFPRAGETLAENLASIQSCDCVILFGLRRRVAEFEKVMALAVRTKANVLLISDESLERKADVTWHVICQTQAPGPLFSHTSVMAYVHVLATRVIELSGRNGRRRLSTIEYNHDILEEF